MFHFFQAITNTAGDSLIGYFGRVIDPATQATITIYADASGTPISTVSGQPNMAVTDNAGNLDFYVDPGTYHLDLYSLDATTFIRRVQNVAMNSTKGDKGDKGDIGPIGASNNTRGSLTELKAANIADKTSLYDGSLWTWTLGDFTGKNDDINIVKADSTPISTGAWVRQQSQAVTFQSVGSAAIIRSAQDKLRDGISVKDFGAKCDAPDLSGAGTDDTAKIQAAIDEAYQAGPGGQPLPLKIPGLALCGNITLHPTSMIYGEGRSGCGFSALNGITGKWWSDNGNGGQKIIMRDLVWFGRSNLNITHGLDLGSVAVQYGTEGVLSNLFIRDIPNGIGLNVDGNVGLIERISAQSCLTPIFVNGNGNQLSDIVSMQAGTGATTPANAVGINIAGSMVRGLHVEAPASGALPIKMNGDCHISDVTISMAAASSFDRIIEVDETNYKQWTVDGLNFLGVNGTVTGGIIKTTGAVPAGYRGGTAHLNFSGSGIPRRRGALPVAFGLRVRNNAGVIQHCMGRQGDPETAFTDVAASVNGATAAYTNTPTGNNPFAGGATINVAGSLILDTYAQDITTQELTATVVYNNTTTPFTALLSFQSVTVNGVARVRPVIDLYDSSGTRVTFSGLAAGKIVVLQINGLLL